MKKLFDEGLLRARTAARLPPSGRSTAEPNHPDKGAIGSETKVLFVCTANVCRSPMAESIFNALARDRGLPLRAESAGVAALQRERMAPNAVAVLEEIGIRPEPHRARQVRAEMIGTSGLVLAMSPRHVPELRRLSDRADKIYTLPEYVTGAVDKEGIPDPYGSPIIAYRASVRQLFEYVELLMDRCVPWAARDPKRGARDY